MHFLTILQARSPQLALIPGEAVRPGFLLCHHMAFPLCSRRKREREGMRTLMSLGLWSNPYDLKSSTEHFIIFSQALFPNPVTLSVRASMYESWGSTVQSMALVHSEFSIFMELSCISFILFHVVPSALALNTLLSCRNLSKLSEGVILLYSEMELLKHIFILSIILLIPFSLYFKVWSILIKYKLRFVCFGGIFM